MMACYSCTRHHSSATLSLQGKKGGVPLGTPELECRFTAARQSRNTNRRGVAGAVSRECTRNTPGDVLELPPWAGYDAVPECETLDRAAQGSVGLHSSPQRYAGGWPTRNPRAVDAKIQGAIKRENTGAVYPGRIHRRYWRNEKALPGLFRHSKRRQRALQRDDQVACPCAIGEGAFSQFRLTSLP